MSSDRQEPSKDQRRCDRRIGWWILGTAVGLILLCCGMPIWMLPEPYVYEMKDPSDVAERRALAEELEGRIDHPFNSFDVDADYLFPLDRNRIALGVQRYALDRGELPPSFEALIEGGYLDKSKLLRLGARIEVALRREDGEWVLYFPNRTYPSTWGDENVVMRGN